MELETVASVKVTPKAMVEKAVVATVVVIIRATGWAKVKA